MFLGLNIIKLNFQPKFGVRSFLSIAGLKKLIFKNKKKQKNLGIQRIEPITFCFRAQAAIAELINHLNLLMYEEL
jgi:hypothetical protein